MWVSRNSALRFSMFQMFSTSGGLFVKSCPLTIFDRVCVFITAGPVRKITKIFVSTARKEDCITHEGILPRCRAY